MALLTNINGKFSVSDAGAVTFNNAFTFPTADGTANYVLKTNGSGQLAWGPDNDSGGDITGSGANGRVTFWTGTKTVSSTSGFTWDNGNNYLSINKWTASTATPAAMLHLFGRANNIDVPAIIIEGRDNPNDTRLKIAVKDPQVRFLLDEGSDAVNGYGLMTFETTAQPNAAASERGGFDFDLPGGTAMTIVNTGNVGIGTTSPNYQLEVRTTTNNRAIQAVNSTTSGTNWGFQGGAYGSGATKNIGLQVAAEGASTNYAALFEGGNVGIGTTSPSTALHIDQSSNDRAGGLYIERNGSSYGLSAFVNSGGYGVIGSNGSFTTDILTMNLSNGNVGIGEDAPGTLLSLKGGADTSIITLKCTKNDSSWNGERIGGINFFSEDGSGSGAGIRGSINYVAASSSGGSTAMTFKTGDNTERMRIDNSGNVIIGNTAVDNPNSLDRVLEIEHGGSVGLILNDSRDTPIGLENRGAVFHLTHNTNSRLVVNGASGNVGIGTTSPDRSLDVEGNGMAIFGTGGYSELMLRGQVEGTGTVRNVGAWHWSVRGDVGGNNDDLKLLRFNTGSYAGTAMVVRSDNGGIAIGQNNSGYSSQILSVKSETGDTVFYGESTDANCFASFRDNSSTANIEYGAIGNAHVFRKDANEHMRIDSSGNVLINATSKYNGYPSGFLTQTIATDAGDVCPILELVGNRDASAGNQNAMIQFFNKTSTAVEVGRITSAQGSAVNSGELQFHTSNAGTLTERMKIDSSGNVGIGNEGTSIVVTGKGLGIQNIGQDTTASMRLTGHNATGNPGVATYTELKHYGEHLKFGINHNGGTDVVTIASTKNVGIGTASPAARLNVSGIGQANNPTVAIDVTNSDSFNHGLEIFDGNLTTGETVLMAIGHSGSTKLTAIFGFIRNENSLDQNLATIGFWGADNKFTVSAGGNVGIGTGTTPATYKLHIKSSNNVSIFEDTSDAAGATFILFNKPSTFAMGSITRNGSANSVSYNTGSDYRLKEDLKDFNALDLVNDITAYDYKWKNTEQRDYGFVAHELKEVLPNVVVGEKDGEIMQGVDYSKLTPVLLKAIQEQQEIINDLKSRIEQLEN